MEAESKTSPSRQKQPEKVFYIAELALRILVIAFSVAGAVTTVTSKESVTLFGITMTATYTYSSSLKYIQKILSFFLFLFIKKKNPYYNKTCMQVQSSSRFCSVRSHGFIGDPSYFTKPP